MKPAEIYITLKRDKVSLTSLDREERALVDELTERQSSESDWAPFRNYWISRVANLYESRGLTRQQVIATPVWKIAQDLGSRIMVRTGFARAPIPDYRDKIGEIVTERFPSQRSFCEATGISEDMLSHVLAHRKHLAVDTLSEALERIGFEIQIVPIGESKS